MATQAGQLLLSRVHVTLPPGTTTVDTGLRQVSQALSPDPPLDGSDVPAIASRVMVIPLTPIEAWVEGIVHGEPYVGSGDTVEVIFNNPSPEALTVNILFWDPHTVVCPLSADPYGTGCNQCLFGAIESDFSNQT